MTCTRQPTSLTRWVAPALAVWLATTACSSPTIDETTDGQQVTATSSNSDSSSVSPPPTTAAPTTAAPTTTDPSTVASDPIVVPVELGVERLVGGDFADLDGRRVALITNQVSMVDGRHLIDWMAEAPNVDLVRILAAEHGVRGTAGAGEPIGDGVDETTGIPILSLYGTTRRPTPEMLDGIDTIVFDLQDVGTRYYTFTATMGLAMQAAAAADVAFMVLDRPNPLGRRVEGDLRTDAQSSFISQYPTPSLHGLTSGELARMIVGEAWLPELADLDLTVIEMAGWTGGDWSTTGIEWVAPSPGLQTPLAAASYPAIVWFEATTLSYGAGTDLAFRAIGAPWLDAEAVVADLSARGLPGVEFEVVELVPTDIVDIVVDPRFEGERIPGVALVITDTGSFEPSATGLHMLDAVRTASPDQVVIDRTAVFDLLAGTSDVRAALQAGVPVDGDHRRLGRRRSRVRGPQLRLPALLTRRSSQSKSASTNSSASKSIRSSTPSPRPTSFTGRPSSLSIANTMPPLAEPSSFVSTTPVTSTASAKTLACCRPFCPVVASMTRSTSLT